MQSQPNEGDHRKMVKTKTPGIFRRGGRYVVVYYDANGRQRKESARTYEDARRLKAARQADVARGEFGEQTRTTFHEYAREWVERHQGRGRRGFRDSTRDDYRRILDNYALRFFGARLRLTEITPRHVANFVGWMCDDQAQTRVVSDKTVRNIVGVMKACLATAREEGLIRHNPADGVSLPHRPQIAEPDEEVVRAFDREQLAALLAIVHGSHRLLFTLLAATGLRISEAIALQWQHLHLDGSHPHVKVRRAIVRGRVGPPKSKHSRRDVPLSHDVVQELRRHRAESEWAGDLDLVFPATNGKPLHVSNLRRRVLKPAAEEAGVPWAGFHAFRHSCASILFERGQNAVQVQRWLGHHSPAFTLSVYTHLLDDRLGEPLDLTAELSSSGRIAGGNEVATQAA